MGRRAQQHERMMADPVRCRHVLTTFLVLAQIVRIVRARTEEDAYFIFAGEPTALEGRVVETAIAVEAQKKPFRDITSRIHAVMQRRRKTADIDVCAFFHDLSDRCLLPGYNDGLHALLHALITGNSGTKHIYTESARQAEPAGHQESHQRQLGALAVDDD